MKIREITEDVAEYKKSAGQSSAIPGNAPPTQVERKKKNAKNKIESLSRSK
jgi:hypothetical protein